MLDDHQRMLAVRCELRGSAQRWPVGPARQHSHLLGRLSLGHAISIVSLACALCVCVKNFRALKAGQPDAVREARDQQGVADAAGTCQHVTLHVCSQLHHVLLVRASEHAAHEEEDRLRMRWPRGSAVGAAGWGTPTSWREP
eukprot:88388-Chlamydomonas_euryale.AAC.2